MEKRGIQPRFHLTHRLARQRLGDVLVDEVPPLALVPDAPEAPPVAPEPPALPDAPEPMLLPEVDVLEVETPLVSELVLEVELEPYVSELLFVPLLQPVNPSASEAMMAAMVNVILLFFIG